MCRLVPTRAVSKHWGSVNRISSQHFNVESPLSSSQSIEEVIFRTVSSYIVSCSRTQWLADEEDSDGRQLQMACGTRSSDTSHFKLHPRDASHIQGRLYGRKRFAIRSCGAGAQAACGLEALVDSITSMAPLVSVLDATQICLATESSSDSAAVCDIKKRSDAIPSVASSAFHEVLHSGRRGVRRQAGKSASIHFLHASCL